MLMMIVFLRLNLEHLEEETQNKQPLCSTISPLRDAGYNNYIYPTPLVVFPSSPTIGEAATIANMVAQCHFSAIFAELAVTRSLGFTDLIPFGVELLS